ncbi:MAG: UDP-N-acetylglucosamine 2-epimerase [Flavobacteriales bacterium]
MNIALLTSSRADFGMQLPLLRALYADASFALTIVAFGSHLDPIFGNTISEVRAAVQGPLIELPQVLDGDGPLDISLAMARTMEQFGKLWHIRSFDAVIALGDRYEMFAAVAAAVPFGIKVIHLHGGETTTGAIDNALRHSITHMATLHFTGAEVYRQRVAQLLGHERGVYNTGALSMDNLRSMDLLTIPAIQEQYGVDLSDPTILITYHPETVDRANWELQWEALRSALLQLEARYRLLVTLPNADTGGLQLRKRWSALLDELPRSRAVGSLGALGYLSCMKHCAFMLGNSSSGYVEASYFPKYVIDVGERQSGRLVTPNILRCPMDMGRILEAVVEVEQTPMPMFSSPYGDGYAAERMVALLKQNL